jgi:flagellar export protein FliJ
VDPRLLSWGAGYIRHLDREEKRQEVEVEKSRDQVEISRHRLVEARQDAKVLEKLKEKRRAAHLAEWLKEQQALIDEVGAVRHTWGAAQGARAG